MERRWVKVGVVAAGGLAAGTVALAAIAAARWNRATARTVARLAATADRSASESAAYAPDQLDGLPAPVARYFAFALTRGQALVRHAQVRWSGEFRSAADAAWQPFTAIQHFTVHPPGFVWDASIRMMPLAPVRVRDGYVDGEGTMAGRIASLIPVVDQGGTPSMAAGALSRFLGEAVWLPTALLPNAGVSWAAVDDTTARATLTDGATRVSADFHFARRGDITGVSMTRYRDVDGRGVPTPFEARFRGGYRRVGGMMVPVAGEVAWVLPEGLFTYWRGRPLEITYGRPR